MAFRLKETIFIVDDLDKAIHFYTEKIGFTLEKRFDWGFALLDVDAGAMKMGLFDRQAWAKDFSRAHDYHGGMFSLQVDDLDAEHARLRDLHVYVTDVAGERGSERAFLAEYPEEEQWLFIWEEGRSADA